VAGREVAVGGKIRVAPSKESLLNALICSIEARDTSEQVVTLHTGTCKRYPSIHSFYTSIAASMMESGTAAPSRTYLGGGETVN